MKIAILSECAMAKTHGTGALMLRQFNEADTPFVHMYLLDGGSGMSECANSYPLYHFAKFSPRSQRLAHRCLRAVGLSLWRKNNINRPVFKRFCRANGISADVAYVIASHEQHAQRFNSILSELQIPYVVHVMDIYHENGLDPQTTPGFLKLLSGAHANLALTDSIRDEMAKLDSRPIELVPVGQNVSPCVPSPPEPGKPLVVVMIGRPYQKGTELLEKAWPQLLNHFGKIELAYIGAHADKLPASMKTYMRNVGYVTEQDQLWQRLSEAHLAFLSGPSDLDYFGKFSFPSRCSDYLMAGLPVVACVAAGSATERFLQPLSPGCVRLARTENEILNSVESLTASPEQWKRASEQGRNYALKHLAIETVRLQIMSALRGALRQTQPAVSEMASAV